jgi:hypothetical protein
MKKSHLVVCKHNSKYVGVCIFALMNNESECPPSRSLFRENKEKGRKFVKRTYRAFEET